MQSKDWALCLGQFLEGVGSLKGLEQEERWSQHSLEILSYCSDFSWRIQKLGLGQGVGSTVQTAIGSCGTSS